MTMDSRVNPSRPRPADDSVQRALAQVGDQWTFLLLREAYFGVRRFDDFQNGTGISPAVLTDRLRKLVANDLFAKHVYSAHAARFEYHLTEKGLDLYQAILALVRWGDRWMGDNGRGPLTLTHRCGHRPDLVLRCDACGESIQARDVTWSATRSSRRRVR